MVAIVLKGFAGEAPRVSDRLLPDSYAATARNTELTSGELVGFQEPRKEVAFPNSQGIIRRAYRIPYTPTNIWVGFNNADTPLVKGPLTNDAYDRYYWSDEEQKAQYNTLARMYNGDPSYDLGIAAPGGGFTVTPDGSGTSDVETRVYTYTFQDEYGHESAPSPPISVSGKIDDVWQIALLATAVPNYTNGPDAANITKRIYRTITGYSSINYFFVAEVPLATTTYDDSLDSADVALNPLLESTIWDPPIEGVKGFVVSPNGFLIGFKGNELFFSEPYRPHAWPIAYSVSVQHPIVGIAVISGAIAVMTTSQPYYMYGTHPANLALVKQDAVLPCLARGSIASTEKGVFYCSSDGIVHGNGQAFMLVSDQILARKDWQALITPETVRAAQYGMVYMGFWNDSNAFLFAVSEPLMRWMQIDRFTDVENIQTDVYSSDVFLLRNNAVYVWNPLDTNYLSYTWLSKKFVSPRPINFGAYKFTMDAETIDYGDESTQLYEEYNLARIRNRVFTPGRAVLNMRPGEASIGHLVDTGRHYLTEYAPTAVVTEPVNISLVWDQYNVVSLLSSQSTNWTPTLDVGQHHSGRTGMVLVVFGTFGSGSAASQLVQPGDLPSVTYGGIAMNFRIDPVQTSEVYSEAWMATLALDGTSPTDGVIRFDASVFGARIWNGGAGTNRAVGIGLHAFFIEGASQADANFVNFAIDSELNNSTTRPFDVTPGGGVGTVLSALITDGFGPPTLDLLAPAAMISQGVIGPMVQGSNAGYLKAAWLLSIDGGTGADLVSWTDNSNGFGCVAYAITLRDA